MVRKALVCINCGPYRARSSSIDTWPGWRMERRNDMCVGAVFIMVLRWTAKEDKVGVNYELAFRTFIFLGFMDENKNLLCRLMTTLSCSRIRCNIRVHSSLALDSSTGQGSSIVLRISHRVLMLPRLGDTVPSFQGLYSVRSQPSERACAKGVGAN